MSTSGPLTFQLPTHETKTAIPVPAEGQWYRLRLVSIEQLTDEEGKASVRFNSELVDPTPQDGGGTLEPGKFGSKINITVPLYAKADAKNKTWYLEKISKIQDAVMGTGDPDNKKGKPVRPQLTQEVATQMQGAIFFCKNKHRVDNNGVDRCEPNEFAYPGDIEVKGAQS